MTVSGTYECKNCGTRHFGKPIAELKIGKVTILLGPCCYLPGGPVKNIRDDFPNHDVHVKGGAIKFEARP